MLITDVARFLPAACAVCCGTAGPFADTQVDLGAVEDQNGFGWLYVCRRCVATMGGLFGFETPEQILVREEAAAASAARIVELEGLLEEAEANRVVPIDGLLVRLQEQHQEQQRQRATSEPPAAA